MAREGAEIVLLYTRTQQTGFDASAVSVTAGMLRSVDAGATWVDLPLVREAEGFGDHGTGYDYPYALFFAEGRLYALWEYAGERSHRLALRSVAFGDGEAVLTLVAGEMQTFPFAQLGRRELSTFVSYNGGAVVDYWWSRYGLPPTATAEVRGSRPLAAAPAIDCVPSEYAWRATTGARGDLRWRFAAECTQRDASGAWSWCIESVVPADAIIPSRTCAPFPGGDPLDSASPFFARRPFVAPGLMGYVYVEADGSPRLARIVGAGADARADVQAIGAGVVPNNGWSLSGLGRQRNRHGDLFAVTERLPDDGARTRLYRWSAARGGFVGSGLPTRPCADDAACGWRAWWWNGTQRYDAVVDWVEPLGGDDYMLFYLLDELRPSSGKHRVSLFMARERVSAATERVVAGALERGCALQGMCSDYGGHLRSCVGQGLYAQAASPARDAVYERLAAARDCAEAVGAAAGEGCEAQVVGVCRGGERYACVAGALENREDCAADGAACEVHGDDAWCEVQACATQAAPGCHGGRACSGADAPGASRDCGARGFGCVMAEGYPACERAAPGCTAAFTAVCDGARAVSCTGPGTAYPEALDCDRLPGFACVEGRCAAVSPDCDATAQARCDGDALVYCYEQSWRELDCAAIGGRCAPDGTSARCAAP